LKKTFPYIILIFILFLGLKSFAQTYSANQFNKEEAFSTSGGVNFSQIFYTPMGGKQRRNPYTYNLNGSVTANIYGFSFPFSFNLSNQQSSFRQPFNQIKIAPEYKWVKLHIGNSNMNWSPLTLAAHNFNGFGVELTPSKFNLSVMYGTLLQPVAIDTTNPNNIASFKRIGYGAKFGAKVLKGNMEAIVFAAHDDPNSIPFVAGYELQPQSNVVMSLKTSQPITKKLKTNVEWATSALTQNNRIEDNQGAKIPFLGIRGNATSSFYHAIKSDFTYSLEKSSIGIGYERIAPEYRTLGAYFFNNNLENITLNGKTGFFKQKVQLSANVGIQRDNIDESKLSSMKRFVSSINLAYAVNKKLNLNGSYSNFLSYSIIRPEIDQINPLLPTQPLTEQDFTQLSHNTNVNASYILKADKDKSQHINLNISQQIATNEQNGQQQNSGTQFYNANLSYNNKTEKTGSIGLTMNGNMNKAQGFNALSLAPGIVYSKMIKEKLQASFGATYSKSFTNGITTKDVANFRLNLGYLVKNSHQFSLSGIYLHSEPIALQNGINEITFTLTYSYRFSVKTKKASSKEKE
jgi:hypothetical protein